MRARQIRAVLASAALAATGAAGGVVLSPARAADSSALTKEGSGPFAGLKVTVGKTANLVNEVVEITWEGARPTEPVGNFKRNYLQVMQCWGDDPDGPRPEQCQWGVGSRSAPAPGAGAAASLRLVRASSLPPDPEEKTELDPATDDAWLPFEAADGRKLGGQPDQFSLLFDGYTTNQLIGAATRGDGTGQEYFEVQTAGQAPGLGCGNLVSAPGEEPRGRRCWLAVVPRSDVEVDGSMRTADKGSPPLDTLQTSPLSASNWKHRLVFPLDFQPIGGACDLGAGLTTVLGHESATEAITRWQPSLCESTGAVFSYNQVPDDSARGTLAGARVSMSVVSRPLEAQPESGTAVYAPIAVSGLGFAYNLETQTRASDPEDVRRRTGQRLQDLRLTPRLVAKLLSQSYTRGVTVVPEQIAGNPARLEDDPEFRALNPAIEGINPPNGNSIVTVITPLNPADATMQVWQWILADAEAREFLSGKPDAAGMKVHPAYAIDGNLPAAELLRADYPKLERDCRAPLPDGTGPLCVLDAFPYSADMHEAVRAATVGDTLARDSWDAFSMPPVYKKANTTQAKGTRAIMAVADTATAARYRLPMAKLKNAGGNFVAPDPANLLATVAQMKPSADPAVLAPEPGAAKDDAYPLTVISYAATVPAALDEKARAAYAGLIEYAAGKGQEPGVTPGSLPDGYAPMPEGLRDAAKDAAAAIRNYAPPTPAPEPQATQQPSGGQNQQPPTITGTIPGGGSTGSSGSSSSGGTSSTIVATPTSLPDGAAAESPTATPQATPAAAPSLVSPGAIKQAVIAAVTPALPVGKARYVLVWLVLAMTLAIAAAQAAPRVAARQDGAQPEWRAERAASLKPHAPPGRGLPGRPGR